MIEALVLGAGAAGLRAGAALLRKRVKVLVVEARDRIGGRVHSIEDRELGRVVELGAEFVHGRPHDELKRAKVKLDEMDGRQMALLGGELRDVTRQFRSMLRKLAKARGAGTAQSWLATARLDPAERELARHYIEGFFAAPATFVGIEGVESEQGMRTRRVIGGYDRALRGHADALRSGDALRLGLTVETVRWRKGRVEVRARTLTGAAEELEAERLVVALPVSVLAALDGVRFDPPLRRKREALAWVRTGAVVKALLRFREPFWLTRALRKVDFFHAPGAAFPTWWRGSPREVPLLTGWAGGPAAERLGREDRLALALDSVSRLFGRSRREVDSSLDGARIVDWSEDPFARGAYAYELAGAPPDLLPRLAAPEEGTLFFAGEAFSLTGRGGTVDGALETGASAARQLLRTL
ncbi:MAG TPA: NAD(P)/FAD-dependent oxidoreductase [Myxococcales bacterium]